MVAIILKKIFFTLAIRQFSTVLLRSIEHPQISKMDSLAINNQRLKAANYFAKLCILDVCGGPGYASAVILPQPYWNDEFSLELK